MAYYGFQGSLGKFRLKTKFLRSWILHSLAYSSPHPGFTISTQRARGVKIGSSCHLAPYVLFDLIFPHLINMENNVSIGSNCMIFAHSNPTANLLLKEKFYPRKIEPVNIWSMDKPWLYYWSWCYNWPKFYFICWNCDYYFST